MKIQRTLSFATSLLFVATTAYAANPGGEVSRVIGKRTGAQVNLPAGESADETREAIRALLRKPLSANAAAQVALLNNRSLQATLEEVGISQADLREAGMLRNPEFTGSARFPDRPPFLADLEGAIAQDFLDLLMLPLRKRVAAAQLEQTQLRVAGEVLDLVAETKTAFYELQAQMQILVRMKISLETHQVAVELAQKQHQAGNINDLALANTQAVYSQERLETAMVEADILAKREKLNRLMGLWEADTNWKAVPELPTPPGDDMPLHGLESLAVSQRLDLAAAQSHLASVVQALGLTKTYRFVGALELGVDSERNPDGSVVTGPTLRVELPIFNQGQARIAKKEAQLRQAERRFEALAIDIRSEVREKHGRLTASADAVKFYRDEIIPRRKQIIDLTQVQYNAMLTGVYDLLAAKQSELDAERGWVEATRDYWIARAGLEQAAGGSLTPRPAIAAATQNSTATKKPAKTKSKTTH